MSELNLFSPQNEVKSEKYEYQKDEVTITSLEIAEITGKEHMHVMRDIRETLNKVVLGGISKFGYTYQHPQNKQSYPAFRLPKREALILVSGYSVELRAKIIDRLEFLENQLKTNHPQLPQTFSEALRALADEVEKTQALELKIEKQKPLVEFAEQVSQASNAIAVGDFAKLICDEGINIGQNKLFEWLRQNGFLMGDNMPFQEYINRGYFKVIQQSFKTPYGVKTNTKTLITGKGQIYFCEKLRKEFNNE